MELDGSSNGSRSRIRFSPEQLEQLENHFREENYPSKDRRTEIAETLQLAPDKVYSWFNNRRVKFRRDEGDTNGSYSLDQTIITQTREKTRNTS